MLRQCQEEDSGASLIAGDLLDLLPSDRNQTAVSNLSTSLKPMTAQVLQYSQVTLALTNQRTAKLYTKARSSCASSKAENDFASLEPIGPGILTGCQMTSLQLGFFLPRPSSLDQAYLILPLPSRLCSLTLQLRDEMQERWASHLSCAHSGNFNDQIISRKLNCHRSPLEQPRRYHF